MFRVDGLTNRIRAQNFFSIELEDQTKHTVSSRMLRTKVNGIVTNLAALQALSLGFKGSGLIRGIGRRLVSHMSEHRVSRNETSGLVASRFSMLARDCGRN